MSNKKKKGRRKESKKEKLNVKWNAIGKIPWRNTRKVSMYKIQLKYLLTQSFQC